MSAARLLAELRGRGVTLKARGERLRFRPASAISPELLADLRTHKHEILELLSRETNKPTPFDQLQTDWRAALSRARDGFAAHDVEPSSQSLEAAAALELWLGEGWERPAKGETPAHERWISESEARALLALVFHGAEARLEDGRVVDESTRSRLNP